MMIELKLRDGAIILETDLDLSKWKRFEAEIILLTVRCYLKYSLSYRDRLSDEDKSLIHSDQGWHYQMKQYRHALEERGIKQSMSRKGNCYDNAVIENFFGIIKSDFLYLKEFESIAHFKQELLNYIDYYNNKRIKAKLKGLSSVPNSGPTSCLIK